MARAFAVAVLALLIVAPVALAQTKVFINEFHYDNLGTDANEFIEIAAPAGTNAADYTIYLYNCNVPSAAVVYTPTYTLSGTFTDAGAGYGFISVAYPVNGIQNGSPDAIALVQGSTVVQFISYEGSCTAASTGTTAGPAAGMVATPLPSSVSEDGTATGTSLQLTGSGCSYEDFSWVIGSATAGTVNSAQTFSCGGSPAQSPPPPTSSPPPTPAADSSPPPPAPEDTSSPPPEPVPATPTESPVEPSPSPPPPSPSPPPPSDCDGSATPIYAIQGSGDSSPLVGSTVVARGVVVGDYQNPTQLSGFYIQEVNGGDNNPATSDGVFVYYPSNTTAVSVGDIVAVSGKVDEFSTKTEISATRVTVCSSNNPLPTPVSITLPLPAGVTYERYEGMLVNFPGSLFVTETYNLGAFGEITLAAGGRQFSPTEKYPLSQFQTQEAANQALRILLDDGVSIRYNDTTFPGSQASNYLDGTSSPTVRLGDSVQGLVGVLDYNFGVYGIQPLGDIDFTSVNRRPGPLPDQKYTIKVGTFNLENYFTNTYYPAGRGASNAQEVELQTVKIVAALISLSADVLTLEEVENVANSTAFLVQRLNLALNKTGSHDKFAIVPDPVCPGTPCFTDQIKESIIYNTRTVSRIGIVVADTASIHDSVGRRPVAQSFQTKSSTPPLKFTVIANHWKSKSCGVASGLDADQNDGQSCWNAKRTGQAQAVLNFVKQNVARNGVKNVLVMGDMNAYSFEDPLNTLRNGGLFDVTSTLPSDTRYSFVFQGEAGALDHIFATPSMVPQVFNVTYVHINSDEPNLLHYLDTENRIYRPDKFRSSDHDPLIATISAVPRCVA